MNVKLLRVVILMGGMAGALPATAGFSVDAGTVGEERVFAALELVGSVCPGLARYEGDLSDAQAVPAKLRGFEGGVEITFNIANPPKVLPSAIRKKAAGHHCSISVAPDNACAYMAKSACHSICEGKPEQNDPNMMGRLLSLTAEGCKSQIGPTHAPSASVPKSNMTLAHKVAIVSAGTYLPPDHLKVKRTRYLLQSLSEKSGEPEQRVGDMAAATGNLIEERYGKRYTVIQLLEMANSAKAVRDGTIGLQEYWALAATLAADL